MKLKEIEKIIDEADFFWAMNGDDKRAVTLPKEQEYRNFIKKSVKQYIEHGWKLVFFKLSDVGFVTKTWFVDCIDKEKKIVKKKLDEMSKEEIIQVRDRICDGRNTCNGCSFAYSDKDNICKNMCDINFSWWKERYENLKNREFDVEVEK